MSYRGIYWQGTGQQMGKKKNKNKKKLRLSWGLSTVGHKAVASSFNWWSIILDCCKRQSYQVSSDLCSITNKTSSLLATVLFLVFFGHSTSWSKLNETKTVEQQQQQQQQRCGATLAFVSPALFPLKVCSCKHKDQFWVFFFLFLGMHMGVMPSRQKRTLDANKDKKKNKIPTEAVDLMKLFSGVIACGYLLVSGKMLPKYHA